MKTLTFEQREFLNRFTVVYPERYTEIIKKVLERDTYGSTDADILRYVRQHWLLNPPKYDDGKPLLNHIPGTWFIPNWFKVKRYEYIRLKEVKIGYSDSVLVGRYYYNILVFDSYIDGGKIVSLKDEIIGIELANTRLEREMKKVDYNTIKLNK